MGAQKAKLTALSGGQAIREILLDSPAVTGIVGMAVHPFGAGGEITGDHILFRRSGLSGTPVKSGTFPREATYQLLCVSYDYGRGLMLAEAVVEALHGVSGPTDVGLYVQRITLEDASEDVVDDADLFAQVLTFNLKI